MKAYELFFIITAYLNTTLRHVSVWPTDDCLWSSYMIINSLYTDCMLPSDDRQWTFHRNYHWLPQHSTKDMSQSDLLMMPLAFLRRNHKKLLHSRSVTRLWPTDQHLWTFHRNSHRLPPHTTKTCLRVAHQWLPMAFLHDHRQPIHSRTVTCLWPTDQRLWTFHRNSHTLPLHTTLETCLAFLCNHRLSLDSINMSVAHRWSLMDFPQKFSQTDSTRY
jgi:hypothetical protein